jgi:hypothetical protein
MLPAPARIAATPSPKSRASWNPAVPPPPVDGAAAGNELAAAGLAWAEGLAAVRADEGLALARGVLTLAVPLGRALDVAEALLPGENVVGVAEGEDAEQAEIDAEASMAEMAQLAAINFARTPARPTRVVRIFVNLLTRPAGGGSASRSRIGREIAGARPLPSPTELRSPEAPRAIQVIPPAQYRHVMVCSPLVYQVTRAEPSGED